ncbi:PspA/IM30 family protein [Paenibacillus sp. FSL R10-2734]|uniref:PspA/IM30 family protein n=1 Tax=Paenibacillus sp. FSL R10-2734 TaxID=2954691 RepID=UPI0030DD60B7
MSLFKRISTLTKAALHEGLNKLESPVLLTGQYLRDLENEIATAERNERDLKVTASVLERRKQEYTRLIEQSEAEAVQAVEQGNEERARLALMAKIRYAEQLEECINSQAKTQHSLAELEINIARAKEEREQLKAKRTELIARAQQATETLSSAPHSSHSSVKGPNVGTASRGFERMEEKIFEWEALAENSKNKFSSGSGAASSIDPNLRSAVDDEIERIRNRKINSDKK